jgi:hypothetical protein
MSHTVQQLVLCSGSLNLDEHQKFFEYYSCGLSEDTSDSDIVSHLQSRRTAELIAALGTPGPGPVFLPVKDGALTDDAASTSPQTADP